jgi:hypothetical protein
VDERGRAVGRTIVTDDHLESTVDAGLGRDRREHEREVAQLQEYIRTLRTNYEGMRAALDAKTLELDKTQRLLYPSGAQDEPYTLLPGELPPAAPAAGAPLPKNVTFNVDAVQFS